MRMGEKTCEVSRHRAHIPQERRASEIMHLFLTPENLHSDAS